MPNHDEKQEEPRNLTTQLVGQLEEVARPHSGQAPLHGRLFSQRLHYAGEPMHQSSLSWPSSLFSYLPFESCCLREYNTRLTQRQRMLVVRFVVLFVCL